MTSFSSAFDWDTNLPPSISSLDENEFLLLLQKQFPAVSVDAISHGALAKGKNTGANPQSLTKFPLPNTASPLSSDSSPSPPSVNEDGSPNESGDGQHPAKRASSADDDHHKRKASADDFDDEIGGQPSAKSQHTDPTSKKTNTRRKSGGGEKSQDETRLLKRKEQNRAAQRAFRERKEKHVKDLEDRVAELLAQTEHQATENENLRDMLSRLQNENVVLKQTTFTFSVPPSSKNTPPENIRDSPNTPSDALHLFASNPPVPGPSSVPASGGSSVATASTHDSPTSLFEGFDSYSGINLPNSPPTATPSSSSATAINTSAADLETIAFFGSPGPFTTLSSNPMYTSYRDPMESMNAFASFGGWDGDINMGGPSTTNENSNAGLEELFGEQFSNLVPFHGDFLGDAKGAPSGSTSATGLSPVGPQKSVSLPDGVARDKSGCPKSKQDIERMVASGEKSMFSSPPVIERNGSSSSLGGSSAVGGPVGAPGRPTLRTNDYDAAFDKALGRETKPVYAGDNFNIDELCLEMQRKAKCSFACATGL